MLFTVAALTLALGCTEHGTEDGRFCTVCLTDSIQSRYKWAGRYLQSRWTLSLSVGEIYAIARTKCTDIASRCDRVRRNARELTGSADFVAFHLHPITCHTPGRL